MLDERKLAVLRAVVTDYVATREPVDSKAVAGEVLAEVDHPPARRRGDDLDGRDLADDGGKRQGGGLQRGGAQGVLPGQDLHRRP